jgi:hypothetical protein
MITVVPPPLLLLLLLLLLLIMVGPAALFDMASIAIWLCGFSVGQERRQRQAVQTGLAVGMAVRFPSPRPPRPRTDCCCCIIICCCMAACCCIICSLQTTAGRSRHMSKPKVANLDANLKARHTFEKARCRHCTDHHGCHVGRLRWSGTSTPVRWAGGVVPRGGRTVPGGGSTRVARRGALVPGTGRGVSSTSGRGVVPGGSCRMVGAFTLGQQVVPVRHFLRPVGTRMGGGAGVVENCNGFRLGGDSYSVSAAD